MAVVYTNTFTAANGTAPTDFVLSEAGGGAGTQDIQSNRFRQQTSTTAGNTQRAILPASSWSKINGRVTASFTTQNPVGTMVPQIYARTSGDWSAEIDTPTTCYKLIHVTGQLRLYKRTGGTTTQLGSSVAFALSASTTYYMSLQCVGTAIKGRISTTADPGTWDIEVTDSSVAGPGQFQLGLLSQASGAQRVDWDDVSLDDLVDYSYDFTGTSGPWSADWTTSTPFGGGTIDIQSNKGRMLTTTTSNNTIRAILSDTLWDEADGEALIDIEFPAEDDELGVYVLVLRGSGTWSTSDSNFPTTGYVAYCSPAFDTVAFYKAVAESLTQIGTTQAFTFAFNKTYRNRFRVQGQTLTLTVWDTAGAEPGTPTYTQLDSTITAAGQFQLNFRNGVGVARTALWDNLTIENLSTANPTGTVAKTLANTTSTATGSTVGGTVAKTLANITSNATGSNASPDYTTDFTGNPGAPWPAEWVTSNNGTGGTIDLTADNKGRMLCTASSNNTQRAILSASVWTATDGEVVIDSLAATENDPGDFSLVLRGSGVWSTGDTNFPTSGYTVYVSKNQNWFRFYRSTGSVITSIGTQQAFSFAFGVTYRHRFQVTGTTVQYKVWNAASVEPGAWTYTQPDSNVTGSGQFMLAFRNGVAVARSMLWDNVALDNLSIAGNSGSVLRTLANTTVVASGSSVTGTVARTFSNVTSAAAGGHSVTGTLARTLGNVTSATAGHHGATGSVARTLGAIFVIASAGSGVSGTLARTLGNAVNQAASQHGVAGSLAKTLANTTPTATGSSGSATTGTVAVTLDNITTTSPLTDEFGVPILDESAAADLLDENGAQILDENGQTITEGSGEPILVPGAVGQHGLGGTVAETLANIISVAAGSVGRVGTLNETLAPATVVATAASGASGTAAVTLGNITSTTAGSLGDIGALNETLDNATSAAVGDATIAGSVAETLDNVVSTTAGTHDPIIVAGNTASTLGPVTSATAGAHGVSGSLAEVLDAAVAAAGGSSQHGAVTETLDALTAAVAGTAGQMPVTGIAAIVLANLTAAAAGHPTVFGTVNRTLDSPGAGSAGSSNAGSVAVLLANVTLTTVGTGSLLEFIGISIRDRGHTVTMRERN